MRRAELREWQAFVRGEAHVLSRFPELVWQGAANQPHGSLVFERAARLQADGRWTGRPWVRLINRPDVSDGCLLDLRFGGQPTDVEITENGSRILVMESSSWITPNAGGFSVWDANAGREVFRLPVPGGTYKWALLPDGRRAVCANKGCARIRDLDGGESAIAFEFPKPYSFSAVAVSSDGHLVAGAGMQYANAPAPVLVWDAGTGERVCELQGHEGCVYALVFTPDGRHLISGSFGGHVRVWGAGSGALVRDFGPFNWAVNDLAVTADGTRLAACGSGPEAKLRIWDLESGQETVISDRLDADALAFSPDGLRLVVAHHNGQLIVFEISSRRELGRLRGHKDHINDLKITPDGSRIVSCSRDRSVKMWDLAQARTGTAAEQARNHDGVKALRFTPRGERLVSYGKHDKVAWDCLTGRLAGEKSIENPFAPGFFQPMEWTDTSRTPDGSRAVRVAPHVDVRAWKKGPISVRDERTREIVQFLGTEEMDIWHGQVEIAPDGERVIALLSDKFHERHALTQWHANTGTVLNYFKFRGDVVSLQLLPDANGVFLALGDGVLATINLDTFDVTQKLRHKTQLMAAVVTPDGRRIVSAGQDRSAFVWDKQTGVPIARYVGGADFGAVGVSDRLIAVGDDAGDVLILELMGVDPGPRLVPLLKDGEQRFCICPYCASRSSVLGQAADEVICAACHQALSIVQVPPCRVPGVAAAAAVNMELKDFIRSPLLQAPPTRGASSLPRVSPLTPAPPSRSKRQGWLRRLLPWAFGSDSAADR